MNLSSGLPYSREVYWALMADYNAMWTGPVVVGILLSLMVAMTGIVPDWRRRHNLAQSSAVVLAVMSLWVGFAHQWQMMAPLNFMAPFYAAGWVAQAGFLLWFAATNKMASGTNERLPAALGSGLLLLSLIVYPLAQWLTGVPVLALDLPGTSPNAMALLTLGWVLLVPRGRTKMLAGLPALWLLIAGVSGYLLDLGADMIATAAGVLCIVGRVAYGIIATEKSA